RRRGPGRRRPRRRVGSPRPARRPGLCARRRPCRPGRGGARHGWQPPCRGRRPGRCRLSSLPADGAAMSAARPGTGEVALPRHLGHVDGPYFGEFGGRYVPEALVAALDDLTDAWEKLKVDPSFLEEMDRLNRTYTGRPSI